MWSDSRPKGMRHRPRMTSERLVSGVDYSFADSTHASRAFHRKPGQRSTA